MKNDKGKRPATYSSNSNVENITNEVNALAARRGITRNAAMRLLAQQPGSSRRHAAIQRAAAAQRVFDSRDMTDEIAEHLSELDLARLSGVSRATRNAATRWLADRQAYDARLPLYRNVKRRTLAKHTRQYPYQGRPTLSRSGAKWPYAVQGRAGQFCSALPPPNPKYPTKASLTKRMERLHTRTRAGMLRLAHLYTLQRELMLVVNGMHLQCPGKHVRLQRELQDLIRWMDTFDRFLDGQHREYTDAQMADIIQRFVARISQLSYHALFIVMQLWGAFR